MTIESARHQFRRTGRAEMAFRTASARRELILAAAITLLMLILTISMTPGSLADGPAELRDLLENARGIAVGPNR